MSRYNYDRLTFLDSTFLLTETPRTPMHVAGVGLFEAGPLKKPDGGLDIDRIRDYVSSRLHLLPRYRQRITYVPVENHPVWVDDHHFNIAYHVRHAALPKPGDLRQLKRIAARILAQHLDVSKPVWEIWFIEGLENSDHFAMIQKWHHCMVDGASTVDLLYILLNKEPVPEFEPAPRWVPRPVPTPGELARDALLRYAGLPCEIGRALPRLIGAVGDPKSDTRARLRAIRETLGAVARGASQTPLNQPVGPHRRFDWLAMDLAAVKAVKNRLGGTVNDVVLATVAGAVRRFLKRRGTNPATLDFRVGAPVSMRSETDHGTMGNRVSAWVVPLPLAEDDPVRRLDLIRQTTEKLKKSHTALGMEAISRVGEWVPSGLLALGARAAATGVGVNLAVTNVPGPPMPLYLLGAKMLENYGFIPLADYLSLGIVLFSYERTLCWGLAADWDLFPDLHDFVTDIKRAFRELGEAPERSEAQRQLRKVAPTAAGPRATPGRSGARRSG